jgi:iron complex outermembrane receptor protein
MFERIEVLKGPSALLNGMPPGGSVGGSINLVPKRAGETPLARVTASYMSDAQWGGILTWGSVLVKTSNSASASTASTAMATAPLNTRKRRPGSRPWAWTGAATARACPPTCTAAKTARTA